MTIYSTKEYAEHLATVGRRLDPLMVRTMNRAGFNIRDDWRRRAAAKNRVHARKYPGTIIMRRTIIVDQMLTVIVEPGGWGQGKLGMVLEYGGPLSRPQLSNVEALDAEVPELAKWLVKIAGDVIR